MTAPHPHRESEKPVPRDERASRLRAARLQAERAQASIVAHWLRRLSQESGPARRASDAR